MFIKLKGAIIKNFARHERFFMRINIYIDNNYNNGSMKTRLIMEDLFYESGFPKVYIKE